MSSSNELVGVILIERSFANTTEGGFETERWSVRVNDGWLSLPSLVRRGSVGCIKAEVLDEDDPSGVAGRGSWGERAPQVWFKRTTRIVAPKGTRLWQRTWRPLRDPNRSLEYPLPQRVFDKYFQVCGEGHYTSERLLAQRAAEREERRRAPGKPLTREEVRDYAGALLAKLDRAAGPSLGTAPAGVEPEAPRRRRAPVRTLALPEPPAVPVARPGGPVDR